MTRHAVGRIRRTVSPLLGAIGCISLVASLVPAPVSALASGTSGSTQIRGNSFVSTPDDKQREVDAIIDELDRLAVAMDILAEDYAIAMYDSRELDKEIAATEVRIKAKQIELAAMQAQLKNVALQTFVGNSISNSLASILSSTGSLSDSVRRSYLTSVALNTGVGSLDSLQGVIEDIARERKQLESQRARAGGIADYARKRLAAAEASAVAYSAREAQALRELGDLFSGAQQRRTKLAFEESARQAAIFSKSKSANVPAPSSSAGTAIKAAMSQLGVRYKFGALSPGVAFDCSGLTSYSWAKAGVIIPRVSRYQYAELPKVPISSAQPGDLIFSYNPVSHVGIYLGGGQMIAAPRTGDVVKISAVKWSNVTGVGRPK
ncbi:MAG: C40 family peptidase [Acidimicrobiaceae bacterium]|nr:C40 family peptidase [Acidimicrobiaceae bacterium]